MASRKISKTTKKTMRKKSSKIIKKRSSKKSKDGKKKIASQILFILRNTLIMRTFESFLLECKFVKK